jgi:hypothetical protein
MYKVKIILISFLSIGFIGISNAHDDKQTNQSTRHESKKNTVITCEVTPTLEKVKTELNAKGLLKEEIADKSIVFKSDSTISLLIDTSKVDLVEIEKRLVDKGYILIVQEEKVVAIEAKSQTSVEKYNPEIDKFLNLEDVSVFNTNFMDLFDYEIHPRSQNYYNLLKNIRTLNLLLLSINYTTIRADLDTIGKLIDDINDPAKSPKNLLPTPLLIYYQSLVKKYGEIYDNIYPGELK